MTPEDAGRTFVQVWELQDTHTRCDFCSRDATHISYDGTVDDYRCRSHTAQLLEDLSRNLRTARASAKA